MQIKTKFDLHQDVKIIKPDNYPAVIMAFKINVPDPNYILYEIEYWVDSEPKVVICYHWELSK